jgi:hypothetical protein
MNPLPLEPNPTETIEINIVATVNKRESYQEQIEKITNSALDSFPELKVEHMNSPLKVRIKIK